MLVGTAETAIAMERIETMMDCFILKSWGWETRIFVDLGKDDKNEWASEVCLVTVCFFALLLMVSGQV
jgi:hypothetical protein